MAPFDQNQPWGPSPSPWDASPAPRNTWGPHIDRWKDRRVEPQSAMIVAVLDRSGSMQATRLPAENGFAEFVEGQRAVPGKCLFTVTEFDTIVDRLCTGVPAAQVPFWRCQPRGNTALVDAVGQTVYDVLSKAARGDAVPEKVFVIVVTDGQENASHQWSTRDLAAMVTDLRERLGWEFVFLGSNIDAWATARDYGFAAGHTMTYAADAVGTETAYAVAAANVVSSRTTGKGLSSFTMDQRIASSNADQHALASNIAAEEEDRKSTSKERVANRGPLP